MFHKHQPGYSDVRHERLQYYKTFTVLLIIFMLCLFLRFYSETRNNEEPPLILKVKFIWQLLSASVLLFIFCGLLIASRQAIAQGISFSNSYQAIISGSNAANNPGQELTYQQYVTPEDAAVKELAGGMNNAEEAYMEAVKWIYVSEQTLNSVFERWLTPYEFLMKTPRYPGNPLYGDVVSDCEEQANTLVSLLRAGGIPAENVRVVLGKYAAADGVKGHAWVELLVERQWLPLDPSSGPYWNDETGKLVGRSGVPFDYYANHIFPVLQIEIYYNDVYYYKPGEVSENVPASWLAGSKHTFN